MRYSTLAVVLFSIAATMLTPLVGAQEKALSRIQVQALVRDGLGDETGAKAIEQRGIDFAPTADFLRSLKTAGASREFLAALQTAKHPVQDNVKKPLNQIQVFVLLAGQVPSQRVAMLVRERGVDFTPSNEYLREVRLGGGDDELVTALKSVKVTKPATVDPGAQARQDEVRQHVARGAELQHKGQFAAAEQEYRAALLLDPENADIYVSLALVLSGQQKHDDSEAAAREALRLNPDNDQAHFILGMELKMKGDWDGVIAEDRKALRLNPNNAEAHTELGTMLVQKGDLDGAVAEYHAALRLAPNDATTHVILGYALGQKGDWDGEIAEERDALRLNPKYADADWVSMVHSDLRDALWHRADWDGLIAEAREELRLNPDDEMAHFVLGIALGHKGDMDGEIAEYREALRLKPDDDNVQALIGLALSQRGDWDGAIAEYREAIRLNPKNADAHYNLCTALEKKGDIHGAREECHAAYSLSPDNADFKSADERIQAIISVPTAELPLRPGQLPAIEFKKLEGTCRWETSGQLLCDIYNGSGWDMSEVTVQITVKQPGGEVVLSRQYRLAKYFTLSDSYAARQNTHPDPKKYLESLKSSQFFGELGLSLTPSQHWEWSFVGAAGIPHQAQ